MGTCYGGPQKELDEHIASKSISSSLILEQSRIPYGENNDVNER